MDLSSLTIPPGGDESRGGSMIAVRAVTTAVATVLISLRLYVRFRIVRAPWWDDLFICLGLALSWVGLVLLVLCVQRGLGRHLIYLYAPDIIEAVKLDYIGQVIIIVSALFTKLSICLFLLRLFAISKAWRWSLYSLIAFTVVTYAAAAALILPQCKPVAKVWNPFLEGTCWPKTTEMSIVMFQGAAAIITDFVLALLPTVFLWNVHISIKHKVGISCLMGLGLFTGACAIVRTVLARSLSNTSDFSWTVEPLLIWSVLECNIAIIAATIPTLRVLFSKELRSQYTRKGYTTDYTSKSNQTHQRARTYSSFDSRHVRSVDTERKGLAGPYSLDRYTNDSV